MPPPGALTKRLLLRLHGLSRTLQTVCLSKKSLTLIIAVVKTRVQSVEHELNPKYATQRLSNAPLLLKRYPSFWRYIRGIAQTEGVQTLYRGLGAACVRAFPTNAAIFFTVAWSKEKMYTMFPDA